MFEDSVLKRIIKPLGIFSLVMALGYLAIYFDDGYILLLTRPSAFFCTSQSFSIVFASVFLFVANLPVSIKAKIFPNGIERPFDIYLKILMLLAVSEIFFSLRYYYFGVLFEGAYDYQITAFALFFIFLYLYNKGIIKKPVLTITGTVYITLWFVNFVLDYVDSFRIYDCAPVLVVLVYMLYITAFPTIKSGFYYCLYDDITFNDKKPLMICISAAKNGQGETELLMKTQNSDFVIYNQTTKTVEKVNLELLIDERIDFFNDMVSFEKNSIS